FLIGPTGIFAPVKVFDARPHTHAGLNVARDEQQTAGHYRAYPCTAEKPVPTQIITLQYTVTGCLNPARCVTVPPRPGRSTMAKTGSRKTVNTAFDLEKSMAELEAIVERMEHGELSLEQTLADFERGVQLSRSCHQALGEAE